jgi:hypothetical protein
MKSMDSDEFLHFVASYKFTLSFENAMCDDYSAILAMDFRSPKELAHYLHDHNSNITKYKSFLKHSVIPMVHIQSPLAHA